MFFHFLIKLIEVEYHNYFLLITLYTFLFIIHLNQINAYLIHIKHNYLVSLLCFNKLKYISIIIFIKIIIYFDNYYFNQILILVKYKLDITS